MSRVISWGKQSLGVSLDDATDQESTLATRQRGREKERGIQLGRGEERGGERRREE